MRFSDGAKAGAILFFGVLQFGLFEMVAEIVYPNYSVSANYISDLGPPCSSGVSCASGTSWIIFDSSIVLLGICILACTYFLYRHFRWKPIALLLGLAGIGALGVGIFNETAPFGLHGLFSLITFLGIGLAAIVSYRLQKPPLGYFAVVMGLVALVSLVLFIPDNGVGFGASLGIGPGGLERLIVYPVLLWSLGFGGQLMAIEETPK